MKSVAMLLSLMFGLVGWNQRAEAQDDPGHDADLEDVAQLFMDEGNFAEALEIYDGLAETYPDSLNVLDMKIDLCAKIPECQPRSLELLGELEQYIARHPSSVHARKLYIIYAMDLKKLPEARAGIAELLKLNPNLIDYWLVLIDYHEQVRDFKKLDAMLAKLGKRFPKNPEIWFRIAERALSRDLRARTRYALAISRRYMRPKHKELRKRHARLALELRTMIKAERDELHRDFREDTRWADLEDDFARSTYP